MKRATNLLLASRFFSEVFGAICFHNDALDGYVDLNDGRHLETLAVYFPNRLDLYDEETKSRLSKEAGDDFYERYCGAVGKMACGMLSSKLLVAYYLDDAVLGICNFIKGGLKGGCDLIFDYFCGIEVNSLANGASHFLESVQTNNGLAITKGNLIQPTVEEFLFADRSSTLEKSEFFRLRKKSKYYPIVEKQEMMDKILAVFPHETKDFCALAERRFQRFQQSFARLTKEEFSAFEKDMCITSS